MTTPTPHLLGLFAGLLSVSLVFSSAPLTRAWMKVADSKEGALQIASQGNRTVSRLKSARMRAFQITPLFSTQNAWDCINTSSREKTVTAVIHANFALD